MDVDQSLNWEPNTWYRAKIAVEIGKNSATVRGKVWPRDEMEPKNWTVEITDPRPNAEGSPTLYGYVTGIAEPQPGTDAYYDNLRVAPN